MAVNRHVGELRRLVRDFLASRESFRSFHEAYLTKWTHLSAAALSASQRDQWNEIYSWILTAIPDPVSA